MNTNLDKIALDLYGKIQTRFTDIKIGDENAEVLSKKADIPKARFFEFEYEEQGVPLGTVAITLDEDDGIVVQLSGDLADSKHPGAFKFLRSFRQFAKDRLLNFDLQNIGKNNLDKRDYHFQAKPKELPPMEPMMESKLYGTSKMSYQDLGENTTLIIKHSQPVNTELAAGRTMHVEGIWVENSQGERFKYPFKHLNGARALGEHLKHGGIPYDAIGKHIVSLSEELAQLRKFKGYVSRNEAIAEAMGNISSKVMERIEAVKKEVHSLSRPAFYEQFAESFQESEEQIIPEEIMNDWVDRLTIRTFNEELKTAFPYIFKLVGESDIPVKEITADDLLDETVEEDAGVEEYAGMSNEEAAFESFLDRIVNEDDEGVNTLFSPNTSVQKAAIDKFNQILAGELKGGPGGINIVDSLKGIIDEPEFLEKMKDIDPDLDARGVIQAELNTMAQTRPELARILPYLEFDGEEGEIGGADMEPPPPEEAPPAPAPAPAEAPPAPAAPAAAPAPAPVAEGLSTAKLKAKFIKAKECGAKLGTMMDFGSRKMTLHDAIRECGLTPMECGFADEESSESGLKQMLKSIAGFWNPQEKNFTIGGTRAKQKVVTAFKNGDFPNASEQELQRVIELVDKMDPSQQQGQHHDILRLAGVNQVMDEDPMSDQFNKIMQQFQQGNPDVDVNKMIDQWQKAHPGANVQRNHTSTGTINGKPASYDDAMKQMPKVSWGGQDFDLNNPDDMGQKIKGMMGNVMQQHGKDIPNQNIQFPGGQMNPHDMMKQIMGKINFGN